MTPQGRLALTDADEYEEDMWIQKHTRPMEYFYEAAYPDLYYTFDLRNPTPIPRLVNNGYTTPEQVAEVIQGLEQHQVRYILWSPDLDVLPTWENPSDAPLGPLRYYIRSHYRVVKASPGDDTIWERRG